jgi:hypothetical protein
MGGDVTRQERLSSLGGRATIIVLMSAVAPRFLSLGTPE